MEEECEEHGIIGGRVRRFVIPLLVGNVKEDKHVFSVLVRRPLLLLLLLFTIAYCDDDDDDDNEEDIVGVDEVLVLVLEEHDDETSFDGDVDVFCIVIIDVICITKKRKKLKFSPGHLSNNGKKIFFLKNTIDSDRDQNKQSVMRKRERECDLTSAG